jgi:hypothetical protein
VEAKTYDEQTLDYEGINLFYLSIAALTDWKWGSLSSLISYDWGRADRDCYLLEFSDPTFVFKKSTTLALIGWTSFFLKNNFHYAISSNVGRWVGSTFKILRR